MVFKDAGRWQGYFDIAFFWNEFDEYVEYLPGFYPNVFPGTDDVLYPEEEDSILFALKPNNVDQARIFGYEVSLLGEGDISPIFKLRTRLGYTYTYPIPGRW